MIQLNLKPRREILSLCLVCGKKVPTHRKVTFHLIKSNELSFKRHHIRCYSTKVIRGYSNGSRCDVKYSKNSSNRSLKGILEVANAWNTSLATYIFITMRRAASLNGNNILYFKQYLQTSSGAIHASSSSPSLSSSRHHGNGANNESTSQSLADESNLWSSVKVRSF